MEFRCEAAGEPVNPLQEGVQSDDIGLKLIQSRIEDSQYRYKNHKNMLFKVKSE
ncbi:hypothetical protein [Syntrophomonas wolfei]|uniref:hypothetical protein n=1 Tax=Syntrophomonas wolfei TaxID=863 RepID=UPI00031E7DD2|nr:hypothetical protein [Syntrophomonas wolfei]